jgi:hypothetical protein
MAFDILESGRGWMISCPALAARIMGAGLGEENAFWIPPALSARGWAAGGNAGGQRTWIAPEDGPSGFFFAADGAPWHVPLDLDPGQYRTLAAPAGRAGYRAELTARTARGVSRRLSIVRSMELAEKPDLPGAALTIVFRHELENAGRSALENTIGLWSIIQLPCEAPGAVFFSTRREGTPLSRHFGEPPEWGADSPGAAAWLRVRGGVRYKVGVSPDDFAGTVGFLRRARVAEESNTPLIMTVMRFDADPSGTYVDKFSYTAPSAPPNGDAAQAYCDAGTGDLAFCEIEAHAPAPFLAPGESQGQEVRITIARVADGDLAGFMKDGLGMEAPPQSVLPG